MRVAMYVRVSSDRQAEKEVSIPAQMKAIQQYCQSKGWVIVSVSLLKRGDQLKPMNEQSFKK